MNVLIRPGLVTVLLVIALAGCDGSPAALRPLPADAVILAFGDSLTWGSGVDRAEAYPALLQRRLGRTVINAGVPGEVSAAGLRRLPALLATHQPRLLVLVHGGNDILRRLPATRTRDHLASMVELARGQDIDVVMLGVPGPHLGYAAPDYYAEVAAATGVPVDVEVLPELMGDASLKSDQVHYNAAGYARMAAAVERLLQDHGALP